MDKKKKIIPLIIVILLIVAVVVAFVVIGNAKSKKQEQKQEEKIKQEDVRDNEAFKKLNEACDSLVDEEGNYNVGGQITEVVCEKGFCHITFNGEDYGIECEGE